MSNIKIVDSTGIKYWTSLSMRFPNLATLTPEVQEWYYNAWLLRKDPKVKALLDARGLSIYEVEAYFEREIKNV